MHCWCVHTELNATTVVAVGLASRILGPDGAVAEIEPPTGMSASFTMTALPAAEGEARPRHQHHGQRLDGDAERMAAEDCLLEDQPGDAGHRDGKAKEREQAGTPRRSGLVAHLV